MSLTFCCLDCERSVTFLKVGSEKSMNLMMEVAPASTLSESTVTCVRCDGCINTKGRLPQGVNIIEAGDSRRFENVHARISKNITKFMKTPEQDTVIVDSKSTGLSTELVNICIHNMDEVTETYMDGLACVTLDMGRPADVYMDFYSFTEEEFIPEPDAGGNNTGRFLGFGSDENNTSRFLESNAGGNNTSQLYGKDRDTDQKFVQRY